mgnify:CR=1 FL=1
MDELANQELLDITSEDGAQETAGDIESQIRKWQTERWKERREKQCLPMEM